MVRANVGKGNRRSSFIETTERSSVMQKISPFLWFDKEAEEAVDFYISVFKNAKKGDVTRYSEAGPGPKGGVMTVSFELEGLQFTALNAGPHFKFSEAISFVVACETQDEVDYYWDKLAAGGEPGPCGWLKDRFGLSWQIVPNILLKFIREPDSAKVARVMQAMMQMKKLDIAKLKEAAE
jgi:predicted 3-demethylubiquinone-9 3-methyltransferase (glyoxalase superfamily)